MPEQAKTSPVSKSQSTQKSVDTQQTATSLELQGGPETATSNHYSVAALRNQVARTQQRGPAAIMALQRTYGNRVTARVLNAPAARKQPAPVQRMPALPDTKTDLTDTTPTYDTLKYAGFDLYNWTIDALYDDPDAVKKAGSDVNTALAYKPQPLAMAKLKPLWNYAEADSTAANIVDQTAKKAAKLVAREKTVKYFLLQSLWQQVAKSTARRIKRNTSQKITQLRRDMAVEAAQAGGAVNAASSDGAALKAYKQRILDSYKNKIKKQEELAQKITYEVAYVVAQGYVKEDDALVTEYIQNEGASHLHNLAEPISEKLQKVYAEKITKPVKSLKRKKARLYSLKEEIKANPTMWDLTKNKYKGKLLDEFTKLETRKYKETLFDKAGTISTDMEQIAETEATKAIESFKFKAAEEVLKRFKAGSASLKTNNTENRSELKAAVTRRTKLLLQGKTNQITTYDALGEQKQTASSTVIKKAKETAIKESLQGPIHSKLRYIGKVVKLAVPLDGDKAKMEFTLKVPVGDPGGGGYLGMRLLGQVEHEIEWEEEKTKKKGDWVMPEVKKDGKSNIKADTFKIKAELAMIGGYRVPFVLDIGGEAGGYLEIESDKGMERAMEMVSFGFYRRFRESKVIPNQVTDALWGLGGNSAADKSDKSKAKTQEAKAWGNAFQESLSGKEFIETGIFGAATGSASITGAASFKGGLKGYTGKRYNKFSMEALAKGKEEAQDKLTKGGKTREKNLGRHMNGAELSFEFVVGPFAIAGKIKAAFMDNQAGSNLDAKYQPDQIDKTISDLKADILAEADPTAKAKLQKELATVISIQTLLQRQWYSLETEASAGSRGGSFANSAQIAAESLKWTAELGAKVRTLIMSFQNQYAKDKKVEGNGSELFGSALNAITAGVNHATVYDPSAAATKLQNRQDLINTQKDLSLSDAGHSTTALDKMHQFAAISTGGMKLTFKHSTKREFETIEEKAKTSKYYPSKFELILDQVSGATLGTQVAVVSLEKATRLLRIGIKYKDGNVSLMTM